jgi:hypothetical protein
MKRFRSLAVLVAMLALLASPLVFAAPSVATWTKNGAVWVKGVLYAGSSGVALTNSTGNLSTTSGAFSTTLAVTGAATLADDLKLTDAGTVAATGPTGASATALSYLVNGVTATTGGLSVVLPTAVTGLTRVVGNQSASTVSLYPFTGDAINAGAANAALSVTTGKTYACFAVGVDNWLCAGN